MIRKYKKFKLSRPFNWLIFEIILPDLSEAIKLYAKGKLLDIGCGEKPFKSLTEGYIEEHVGVDHNETFHDKGNIDIFGSAYALPVEDKSFDTVLCTDVLEHLEEPDKAINEAYRVLKPNAYAIYTVPFFWHIHEAPRDFYRFTEFGLRYLFEKNNFTVVSIQPLSGFIVMASQEFCYYLWSGRRVLGGKWSPFYWAILALIQCIQYVALFMNRYDKSYQFSIEYLIVAKKNASDRNA